MIDLPPPDRAPLGLYVHWPYCARICPYCDFNVALDRRPGETKALAEAILADLHAQARELDPRRLVSIFFGGGTPSLMDPEWAARIVAAAQGLWPHGADLEVTLEANPTDAEAGRFAAFAQAGVNRLSLGVQALDDDALRFLGRNHGADEARRAAAIAAKAFPRLSLDLIYARPGQTAAAWAQELKAAVDLGAEHISPYQLTIEPGTPFDRAVARRAFTPADPDLAADLYDTTQAVLSGLGFQAYEVSNHARGAAAEARHNLVYWRGEDYLGVGPGAHGRTTTGRERVATVAHAAIPAYVAAVRDAGTGVAERDRLDARQRAEERLMMGLRTLEGVSLAELGALKLDRLDSLEGFVRTENGRLYATSAGRLVLNRVIAELAGA